MDSSLAFGQTFVVKHLLPDGINFNGQLLCLRPNNMRAPVSGAACSMRAQRGATADAGASLKQTWKIWTTCFWMVLGFPGPETGASLKQTWKTWKTWKTCFVHGFGIPRPGAGASLKQTWKVWKTWKTSFCSWFGVSQARRPAQV